MNKNPELSKLGEEAFGDFLRAIAKEVQFIPAAILTFFNGDELVGEVRLDYQDAWTNHDGLPTVTIAGDDQAVLNEFVNRWASVLRKQGVENIEVERPQSKQRR